MPWGARPSWPPRVSARWRPARHDTVRGDARAVLDAAGESSGPARPGGVAPPPGAVEESRTTEAPGPGEALGTAPDRPLSRLLVVIVTFRSAATLPACLASLAAEAGRLAAGGTAGVAVELVLVENGGDAALPALAARLWPGAEVIVNAHNRGFAAAVNQGLARLATTSARAVLLLNPDAVLLPGALGALLGALERSPRAGIVAPRLLDPRGRPVLSCYPFLSLATVAWRHFQVYRLLPNVVLGRYRAAALAPDARVPLVVEWAQGACLLVRRAVVEQVGGLDERFFFYGEEVDYCRRAARAGWQVLYVPTARVRHAEGSSSGKVVPFKLASHYYCKVAYFAKHRGPAQTALLRGLLLADLGLRMLYRGAGALVGRPPDARRRLAAYRAIAGRLLGASAGTIVAAWRAEGERL